ncbi:RNA polymerase, sigma 54 subunit, RpoN [Melioribacter roseus P3M-2]|uniref:RNA polymerase, sigma 54 subunit, RpoN n=1 Tax=Melioribacter roseus (strain DSM 23840 / JCM 17771 / VKM B-2668 / P3M-2) TaxID=1191523 RepID=I6ZQL4_MELRP|nr:RNA polymerase factor sigma-54 [Melioribacter roseus]AFN74364.1 RNA polymerase, sigma 54 subunit, RpoN [Melioribacter roseus P3M-2]
MLSLQQKMSLQQKLSPQQIQYQKLLQLNTLALEQRIKTELELNPILEETLEDEMELEQLEEEPEKDNDSDEEEEEQFDNSEDEFDLEDFMNDSEYEQEFERLNKNNDEEKVYPVAMQRKSMRDNLIDQLHMLDLTEEEMILGENIIGALDKDGYFKEDLEKLVKDLKLFEGIEVSLEDAEKVLKKIQTLEPVGIAARNLQECLLIQIRNSSYDPYYSYIAEKILSEHFEDFINKRFDIIQKNLNLSTDTLKSALAIIQKLNPKPGEGNIDSEQINQITPDFIIEKVDDNYIVTLNDRAVPSVTISKTYLEMLENNKRKRKIPKREKEAHKFLREKFESAKWFIASLQQRRQTLMKIMQAILEKQYEFFENGPKYLKPMIYKDIADEIGMDISTISRVVNGKYVQSPQGIHELKYFFSEGLSTDDGNEISNKHIKELIKEICENEPKDKPYSDDKIASILQEKGIHIARRTVAKYREQLKIPVARLRKKII